ncbi:MAG: transglycosylase domain-containing protein, partial [bacterium]|nr:transglycosylase domain-containing protein [bacterium]
MPQRIYFRDQPANSYRKTKPSKRNGFKKAVKLAAGLFFICSILSVFVLIFVVFYFIRDLPNPENLFSDRQIIESTKIYDRTGEILLYDVHGEERRTVIAFSEINDWVKKATIAAEDADFYAHRGFDIRGIGRAVLKNIFNRQTLQGGSTITQQLVKNSFLTPEKTISRKIKEFLLALAIEKKYSKDEILELYLNQIPYGNNAYGIETAANTYFNKRASELSLAEAAYLAALPQAPSYYSPHGNRQEELENRKNYILERMKKLDFIQEEEFQKAQNEKVEFMPPRNKILAPHFVMLIREELNKKYGEKYIETAGLKIITTLDYKLQKMAEEIVKQGALENEKKYNAKNAALVAQDPKTGQVLAMVGSRDYWEEPKPKGCQPGKTCQFEPNTNVAVRERQPGSAFKPFAYAAAFKKGYPADTILFDLKTEFHPG